MELLRLNIWPYDLEHVSRVMLRIDCAKFKLSQAICARNLTITFRLIRYVTLWPWPLTRWAWKFVVHRVTWSKSVRHLSEIEQSPAELLIIWQIFVENRGQILHLGRVGKCPSRGFKLSKDPASYILLVRRRCVCWESKHNLPASFSWGQYRNAEFSELGWVI